MGENHRARSILKENFPQIMKEKQFFDGLDEGARKWLVSFLKSLGIMGLPKISGQQDSIGYNLMMQNNLQNNLQSNHQNNTFNFQNNFEYDFQNQIGDKK